MKTEEVQNIYWSEKKQNVDDWKQGKAFPRMLITDHVLEAQIDNYAWNFQVHLYNCDKIN